MEFGLVALGIGTPSGLLAALLLGIVEASFLARGITLEPDLLSGDCRRAKRTRPQRLLHLGPKRLSRAGPNVHQKDAPDMRMLTGAEVDSPNVDEGSFGGLPIMSEHCSSS
jgi:hypothetical protein